MNLISLEFSLSADFHQNLATLKAFLHDLPEESIIVAPEMVLSGFCYTDIPSACDIMNQAMNELPLLLKKQILVFSGMVKENNHLVNRLVGLTSTGVLWHYDKHKLFPLGDELRHFSAGQKNQPRLFSYENLTIGVLICYELRFLSLWEELRGADVICVCALWGKERHSHFITLVQALALQLQCYVIASNGISEETQGESMIISPWNDKYYSDSNNKVCVPFNQHEILKSRRVFRLCEEKN